MITFIDDHRQAYGVEPICKVLPIPIASSSYRKRVAQRRESSNLIASSSFVRFGVSSRL